MRLSENGYFPQSLRQAQIIILEILQCIPVVIIFAFLDLGKNISFSDSLLGCNFIQNQVHKDFTVPNNLLNSFFANIVPVYTCCNNDPGI